MRETSRTILIHGVLPLACLGLVLGLVGTATAYEWVAFSPEPRCGHQAVLDSLNERMVLVAGWGETGYMNDAWALHSGQWLHWRPIRPSGSPPPGRMQYSLVLNTADNTLIVFGGNGGGYALNDIWELTLTPGAETWTDLSPTGPAPEQRHGPVAVYDPIAHRVVIFGGVNQYPCFNDVWAFDLTTLEWTQLYASGTPPSGRKEAVAIYDPEEHRMIVFGGYNDPEQFLNDTWALSLEVGAESWVELNPSGGPPAVRRGHDATYDWVNHRMLIFGGWNYPWFQFYNDLWALDLEPMVWTQIPTTGHCPSAARNQSIVFFARGRCEGVVTFGGNVYDGMTHAWYGNEYFMRLD